MSHSKPVNVVTIQKDPTRRRVSSYVLHTEALRRLLEPIKDKELAIISVVGDARRGKSFLLNYMAKFLADKDNWLSNRDAKLKGFHWQSDDDPQTMGFWLSQPFPVKKSDGSEIYVLLMDTQGLFDRFSNTRDWSTIVGFSLLVSSCVIFNVFNSLDEKIFETFDTFIKYGLEAMHTKNDQTAPFQKLVFLIRDWNIATKFKFGSTGSMKYLDKQLTETENMSPESVAVRQNIKKCFESISCFLMPTIGDGKDSEDFDGRVSQLREDFVYKMRDFITILLNSEEMSPKMIDKTPVTGEEMFHYFRSCVDVFNNSEGPDVQRIIDMTAKIEANIYLRKLKDLHLAELRSFCLTKPFVTNAELRECNEESKTKIINMFESSSVACDQKLKDNLYEYVKKNLKLISDENDSQRMKFMENKIEECVQMFQKVMEKLLANGLPIDSKTLEELFKVNRKNVFDEFKSSFGGEEDMLFNNDLFELTKFINNYESATRIENLRRIDEFKNTLSKYVEEINDFYSKKMVERSEQCVYLNKEQFRILEAECRSDTEKFYQEKLKNLPIDENFYLRVDKKLKESKNRFKNDNQIKCENVVKSTENAFQNGINEYKKRMIETIDIINSVNDLDKHHQNLIRRVTQDLNNNCVFKAPYFISSYEEKFREDIRKLYEDFVEALKLRIDGIHQRYRSGLEEAKSLYDQQMKETIETRSDLTSASLTRISRTLVKNALDLFDNNFDPTSRNFDPLYKSYRGDLKDALGEQFDEFVEQLEKDQMSGEKVIKDKMRESLDTFTVQLNESIPLVNNEDDFVAKCVELRDRSVQEFRGSAYLSSISDQSLLNSSIKEFETKVDERVKECRTNQEQRKSQIEQANRNKVAHAKDAYMKQMSELLRIEDLVSDEEFREFTDELKRDVLSTLSQQLESLYTDDTQNFYDEVNQFIDQEFDRFFVVNEAKRNNRLKMIKELAEKYIEEYREQMNESLDSIKSEEQLLREHNHLLECLLEKARQSDDLKSKKLIGHQLSHIETEISKLFTNNLTIFRENIGIFDKTCKELFEQSKDQYIAKMDSHFKDDKFYSDKEMNDFQNNVKTDTITHFLDEVSTKGLKSQTLVDQYVQQLNEFFEQTFVQYIQKNEDNRSWFETKLREKSEELVFRYELDMNSNSESMLCLEDLNAQHNRLMEALLKIFNEHIQKSYKFIEFSLLDKYQWDLQTALSNKLPALADKLRQRLNKIIEGYRTQSCILEETYVLKVEELVKDDELLSDESLEELHKRVSNEVIVSFEDHLRTNPCSETQSHFIQFKDSLDALFADIAKRYKTDRNLKLKNLEFMVNDFINMYEKAMKDQLKNIENLDQLAETHEKVKEQVIQIFREMSQLKDAEQLKTFTDKILDNIDNSLIDFRDILELHIENQQTLAMNLRLEIRRYYKEEMHRYMANKLFVPTVVLDKCHHKVVRNTKDHYKEQRRDINDKNFVQLVEDSVEDIYKKIKEENEMKKPTTDQAIGIDFGTTNSCVAYFRADSRNPFSVFVIPNELGHNTTPSVFSQRPDGTEVVGFYAKDEIHFNSRNTIISPKRLIGRTFDDQNVQNDRNLWPYDVVNDGDNKPKISIMVDGQEQTYYPEQVAAKVLKKMKDIATNHLGCEVTKAVITVPAYFNDSQKEATKQAGQLAGLEVLKIINEPTAAAFAFKVDRDEAETRNVLIYDFGGGTFDVAILEIKKGEINVKAVGGDNHLGGDDVDTNLINHCLKEFRNQFKVEVGGPEAVAAMSRLRRLCEENKKRLTSVESTTISIPNFFQLNDLNVFITRDQFEAINEQLFARTIDLTNSTLIDAGLSHSNINDVVLVGGSTRIPRVQQMLSRLFGDRPLNHSVNPDEAVAVGAAIRAALLNGQQSQGLGELVIRDVTPLSLGIRIKGGSMSTLIPRNTTVPVKHTRQYYTSEDNQTVVTIAIFEGEKKMANDNHQLGEFELSGIPLGPRGEQPIDVTFDINDEGILHVKAKIVNTGGEEEIEITEHKGRLTDEQLESLMNQNS